MSKILVFYENKISRIKGLERRLNLEELYLNANQIYRIENLDNLHNLEYIDLSGNQITELKGVDNLPNLAQLILRRNYVYRSTIMEVGELKNPNLKIEIS